MNSHTSALVVTCMVIRAHVTLVRLLHLWLPNSFCLFVSLNFLAWVFFSFEKSITYYLSLWGSSCIALFGNAVVDPGRSTAVNR